MNRKQASITIETALVLPLFIFAALSMMFFIEILNVQEKIQHSLHQTANRMSAYAYIYDRADIRSLQQDLYKSYSDDSENVSDQVSTILTEGKDFVNNIKDLGAEFQEAKDLVVNITEIKKSEPTNIIKIIENYKNQTKTVIENIIQITTGSFNNINSIAGAIGKVIEYKDELSPLLKKEGLGYAVNFIWNQYAKLEFKNFIDEDYINNSIIVGGMKGLDFSRSEYMLINDDLDIIVTYRVRLPIAIPFIDEIPIIQRVVVRAWTGYRDENSIDTDVEVVYITKTGGVYHTHRDCTYIDIKVREVEYESIGLRSCERCANATNCEGKKVYITKEGECYHIRIDCSSLYRQVTEIPKDSVGEMNECSRCQKRSK